MADNILKFPDKQEEKTEVCEGAWLKADVRCTCCNHRWTAPYVETDGVVFRECPNCSAHAGIVDTFQPADGILRIACGICGCQHFFAHASGHLTCPGCGLVFQPYSAAELL